MGCAVSVTGNAAPRVAVNEESFTGKSGLQVWTAERLESALRVMPLALERAKNGELIMPTPVPEPITKEWESWDFDIFTVAHGELPRLAFTVLTSHPEMSAPSSNIDRDKLWRFVNEVAARHTAARPFHSFRHGCDVLLGVSALLRFVRRDHTFGDNPLAIGGLLVGALVHDTNHPGCMNGFLIATEHALAAGTQTAILETHHAQMALALLERPELDFLSALPPEDRSQFVASVREVVMATDVTTTIPRAKEFESLLANGQEPSQEQVIKLLIKAADISNPTRPFPVYEKWVGGVMAEFFAQGDAEKARGLPISMNCDRETVVTSKCQVSHGHAVTQFVIALALIRSPVSHPRSWGS